MYPTFENSGTVETVWRTDGTLPEPLILNTFGNSAQILDSRKSTRLQLLPVTVIFQYFPGEESSCFVIATIDLP